MVMEVIQTKEQLEQAIPTGKVRYGIVRLTKDYDLISYDKDTIGCYETKEERDEEYNRLYEEYRYKNIRLATEDYILED